ncbi:MAG: hypothetical protein ACRCZ0_11535 [Cetobacterium sp.]
MKLKELLERRAKGEQLNTEELEFLAEYDSAIAVQVSELEKLRAEKEEVQLKLSNADTELQARLKALSDKEIQLGEGEKKLAKERKEREDIQKILDNAKSTEEAKLQIAEAKAEKKRAEELEKIEKENSEKLRKAQELKELETSEKAKLESELATLKFERLVIEERTKRPYISNQLDNILEKLPEKGVTDSSIHLNVLLSLFNHEEEMAKYSDKKRENTDIFGKQEVKEEINPPKKFDYSNDDDIIAMAKKLGFKTRKAQSKK